MTKSMVFGIWEFIFLIIVLLIIAFFVWPAIDADFTNRRNKAFDKTNREIINIVETYVESNPEKFSSENVTNKVTLDELYRLELVDLPIKNIITNKNLNATETYVTVIKNSTDYKYELVIKDEYKNAVSLKDMDVKIGDYVDYPVEYDNVNISDVMPIVLNGWRVISITDSEIQIISSGVPKFIPDTDLYERVNDITNYEGDNLFGDFIDYNFVINKPSYINNKQVAKIALSSDLRTVGISYYIFKSTNKQPMVVTYDGIIMDAFAAADTGIRPVLILRKDIRTTGRVLGKWQLVTK